LPENELNEFKVMHLNEIEGAIGDDGVWFNSEVLIAVGKKPLE